MKKMNLTERKSIEIGIVRHYPLSKIADIINMRKSSVARKIKIHRIFIPGNYYAGNDCKYAKGCIKRHLCGNNLLLCTATAAYFSIISFQKKYGFSPFLTMVFF